MLQWRSQETPCPPDQIKQISVLGVFPRTIRRSSTRAASALKLWGKQTHCALLNATAVAIRMSLKTGKQSEQSLGQDTKNIVNDNRVWVGAHSTRSTNAPYQSWRGGGGPSSVADLSEDVALSFPLTAQRNTGHQLPTRARAKERMPTQTLNLSPLQRWRRAINLRSQSRTRLHLSAF